MSRTRTRTELPTKYNERERKLGRSRTAMYREEGGDWVFNTRSKFTKREKEKMRIIRFYRRFKNQYRIHKQGLSLWTILRIAWLQSKEKKK